MRRSVMGAPVRTPRWVLLGQVGEDEPLPVPVQQVLAAAGCQTDQTAAPGQGLQEEMDLGVVAQGLKVAHPLHRGGDGLLVHECARRPTWTVHVQSGRRSGAVRTSMLHLAHEAGVDLPAVLVHRPGGAGGPPPPAAGAWAAGPGRGTVRGEDQAVGDHRLQQGGRRGRLGPQALAGVGLGEPQQRRTPCPADTASAVWYLAPEYRRSWVTFSSSDLSRPSGGGRTGGTGRQACPR